MSLRGGVLPLITTLGGYDASFEATCEVYADARECPRAPAAPVIFTRGTHVIEQRGRCREEVAVPDRAADAPRNSAPSSQTAIAAAQPPSVVLPPAPAALMSLKSATLNGGEAFTSFFCVQSAR